MTELAIPESAAPAVRAPQLQPQLPVPAMNDIDSWTRIVVQVVRLAEEICDTPFVPDGLRGSAPAVSAAILSGREMGLGPMTSLANIDVIKGKPTQKPLLMRAMVQARGHKWVDVDVSDVRAVVKGCRKGESEWTEVIFTAAQAKQGGIDLGKYPADKLYARASSRLCRRKFADVIMGMAYSADEAEDDDGPDVDRVTGEVTPATETPPPRTAQRKPRAQSSPPAQAATPPAVPPSPPAGAGGDLPPLPGEEEGPTGAGSVPASASTGVPAREATAQPDDTDYDTPGTATRGKGGQLTALWTVLSTEFGFKSTDADKAQARTVCEHVINRALTGDTTGDLSYNEARTVLDTLAHWQHQAAKEGREPREYMFALMVATDGEVPNG